ncbi:MAG: hypothetical protein N4A65_00735 [Cohaesibacter sp.]|jgi:hypothetical protein|nr:hypothetical protein [Cohaesibacter sp.]
MSILENAVSPDAATAEHSHSKPTSTMWDPFKGSVPFQRETFKNPGKGIKIPAKVQSFVVLLLLISVLGVLVGFVWITAAYYSVGPMVISAALLGLFTWLSKEGARERYRFFKVSERQGWAFTTVRPPSDSNVTKKKSDGTYKREQRYDPKIEPAYATVPDLMRARFGQPIPTVVRAIFWGRTQRYDLPFWLAAGSLQTFGGPEAKRTGQDVGYTFTMVTAYQLDRDIGIRAKLFAEPPVMKNRKDVQTESVAFNEIFHISVTDDPEGEASRLPLIRTLTPALQTVLIDLWHRYKAQVIIDRNIVYLAGYQTIMSDDDKVLEDCLTTLIEDFAEAAQSFKIYAE